MPYRFECHRAYFSPSLAISFNLGPLKPIFVVAVTLNMSVACIKDLGVHFECLEEWIPVAHPVETSNKVRIRKCLRLLTFWVDHVMAGPLVTFSLNSIN